MSPENVAALAALVKAPGFESLQNDIAYQAHVGRSEAGRQKKFYCLEAGSRPRRVKMRADPAAYRGKS